MPLIPGAKTGSPACAAVTGAAGAILIGIRPGETTMTTAQARAHARWKPAPADDGVHAQCDADLDAVIADRDAIANAYAIAVQELDHYRRQANDYAAAEFNHAVAAEMVRRQQ